MSSNETMETWFDRQNKSISNDPVQNMGEWTKKLNSK